MVAKRVLWLLLACVALGAWRPALAFEQTLLNELEILEAAHSARLDYCAGLAKQAGPLRIDPQKVKALNLSRQDLEAALSYFVSFNTHACEQTTLLPLSHAVLVFNRLAAPSHPAQPRVSGLLESLLPPVGALKARGAYESLLPAQKDALQTMLTGRLFSITQITNFEEIRAVVK